MPRSRARPTPMTSLFARLQNPDTAAVDVCDRCRRVVVSASSCSLRSAGLASGAGGAEGGRKEQEGGVRPALGKDVTPLPHVFPRRRWWNGPAASGGWRQVGESA